jgi:uncharacterized protein (TIGR03437 family)
MVAAYVALIVSVARGAVPPLDSTTGRPVVTNVVNAAGGQPGFAQASWVAIYGNNLADHTRTWRAEEIQDGRLPTSLDGASVTINGKPAFVYFISPTQVNVQAPSDSSTGTVPVVVTNNGASSDPASASLQEFSPGLFLWQPGSYAVATHLDFSLAVRNGEFPGAATFPAQPNEIIILWGTGFGATDPAVPAGETVVGDQQHKLISTPAVTIGGMVAEYVGCALTPGSSGLYQLAVRVPPSLSPGDYPVFVEAGGVSSPSGVRLPVASSDPLDPVYLPPIDTNPEHYPANVWVTGSLAKVQPQAAPGAAHWALISAARNEFESFQVHLRAGATPIQMGVTVTDFVNSHTGGRIPGSSSVFLSREAYLDITQVSDLNGTPGITPDPLIPVQDRYFHEPRNAFPVTVPANETRSAWIDVFVPPGTPSGYYAASASVTDGGSVIATLPVQLKVWDFEIPSTATLTSAFGMTWNGLCVQAYGSYFNCGQYPGSGGSPDRGVELSHVAQGMFFLDHRVTISDIVSTGPAGADWSSFDATYGPLMDGSGPTALSGARLTSMKYVNSDTVNAADIRNWVAHFGSKGWISRLFHYHCDEPPYGCTWDQAVSEVEAVRAASPDMQTLLTTDIAGATQHGLLDAVDILTPVVDAMEPRGGLNLRPSYDTWLGRPDKHLWWYQACGEHESCSNGAPGPMTSTWPSYMVDASPVRNRIFQWMAFLYGIQGELYYLTDYCWVANDCGSADPWVSLYAFGGNGDGTLFYPGTAARIGGTTPVPVSSIRLELIRDGMEDYEYLMALANSGDAEFATTAARSFITNAYNFDNNPDSLLAARESLGARLHQRVHPR